MTRRCSPILSATRVTIMCCSARTGRSIWAASSRPTRSGRCAWAPLRRTAYSVATPADCSGCAVRGPRGDRGIRRRGGRRRPTARAAPSGDRAVTAAFDVVVAGAGHNSLVATAYLARAGLRCVVLEASQEIGGDTGSAGLTMWRDEERTAAEFARFSVRDAAAYRRMMADYGQVAPVLSRRRYTPAGQGQTTGELLAGQPGGERWLRADAMSAWDVISAEFEDEHVRAFLLWMSFMTMQPPGRPGTGLLAYSLAYGRQRHSWTLPRGGSAALPRALARVIESRGGVIVTGAKVTE